MNAQQDSDDAIQLAIFIHFLRCKKRNLYPFDICPQDPDADPGHETEREQDGWIVHLRLSNDSFVTVHVPDGLMAAYRADPGGGAPALDTAGTDDEEHWTIHWMTKDGTLGAAGYKFRVET
jgi:hypothetical protein